MKKALVITAIVIGVIFSALIAAPFIFKDDIKKAVDDAIAESVNGKVIYSPDGFSVSLIRNFPNLSVSFSNFGVIGAGKFEGDTLAFIGNLNAALDVMSAISGEKIIVNKFILEKPFINGIILKDGSANYLDIIKDTTTEEETPEESSKFNVSVKKWQIIDARIKFSDETFPMVAEIKKLNHEGSGDFTQDIFDFVTTTKMEGLSFEMDNTDYLNNANFEADMTLNMDMSKGKYTFKENLLKLNDFSFGFDGWLTMNEDGSMDMDIKYETKKTDFKNILSLVPGVFMEGFEKIKTKGTLAFNGDVIGKYDSLSMPGFKFNLQVADAMFQYPDLPSAVENIAVDLAVASEQNKMEEMTVNLNKFHLDMGKNPVDATTEMKFKGSFDKIYLNSNVNAKVNLGDISKFYPIEGLDLKGMFTIAAKAMGTYDMENNTFPSSNSNMTLTAGYVKSADFPAPIENLAFDVSLQNENGSLEQTYISINRFNMLLDGEPMEMTAKINNLDNVNFDVNLKGKLDFDKLTKIYPLEGMTLKGKMDANISTKGTMKDVEDENYGNIPTSGLMTFQNFEYYDAEYLPNGFKMTDGMFAFTPSKIVIEKLVGFVGNSDINVTGSLSNYINYTFGENEVLKGEMIFASNTFDVDEWMVEEELPAGAEEEPLEVYEVPKDIEFLMHSQITDVKYDNMGIKNLKGDVIMKDGKACFDKTYFECIGGQFITSGCYDPTDMAHPKFSFDLDIKNAQIAKAYETFNTIQTFAPIAKTMQGAFSTKFTMNGELDQELFPIMNSITGKGLINVEKAKLTGSTVMGKISKLTGMKSLETVDLSSMLLDAEIKEGRLHVKPFETKFGPDNLVNISGSNGVDGTLDYLMKMNVPSGSLGQAAGSAMSNLTGSSTATDRAQFDVLVNGLMNNPAVKMNKDGMKDSAKDVAKNLLDTKKTDTKNTATSTVTDKVEDKKAELKAQADAIMATAQKQADALKAQSKASAEKVRKEGYAQADNLENSSNNPVQKKVNKIAADKLRKETDEKANKIITEGNTKADKIMADAKAKADALYK